MTYVFEQDVDKHPLQGLWTAEFGSSVGIFGGGVAVFLGGKVLGGDGSYFYVGNYQVNGNNFTATLTVSPFISGAQSVFGTVGQALILELSGSMSGVERATAQGHPTGKPDLRFGVKLTRRA